MIIRHSILLGVVLALCCSTSALWAAPPEQSALTSLQQKQLLELYGALPAAFADQKLAAQPLVLYRQGNDSNCEFVAAANGLQAIGGDGAEAYTRIRQLIVQAPIDYHEGFYTLYGPNGSDRPFSLDNLGAAPEAFLGVYERLGYNATLLAAPPHVANIEFVRALREQLARAPERSFAHLWTTPKSYNAQARTFVVSATGERVPLLYPYHEVAALADPNAPNQLIILDGLVGHPFVLSLEQVAARLRGFNKLLIVSQGGEIQTDRIRSQISAMTQPFALVSLGGSFLTKARQTWGAAYATWGQVIGPPFQMDTGSDTVVRLPGEYVLYEWGNAGVNLALLGSWMRDKLVAQGLIGQEHLVPAELHNALGDWAVAQFGTIERFHAIYGPALTDEFWLTPEAMQTVVFAGREHALLTEPVSGYMVILTERAMLVWSPEHGVSMVPLGSLFYAELRAGLGV